MKGTTTGRVKTTCSISTFVANAGEGGAVARALLVWRVVQSITGKSRRVCVKSIGVCSVRTDG